MAERCFGTAVALTDRPASCGRAAGRSTGQSAAASFGKHVRGLFSTGVDQIFNHARARVLPRSKHDIFSDG